MFYSDILSENSTDDNELENINSVDEDVELSDEEIAAFIEAAIGESKLNKDVVMNAIKEQESNDDLSIIESESYVSGHAKNFLESVMNDNAKEIRKSILDIDYLGECSIDTMIGLLEQINSSGLHRSTRELLVTDLYETYIRCRESEVFAESIMLEFSGDPVKNKEFVKYLNLMEKYIKDYGDYSYEILDLGDKMLACMRKAAKSKPENTRNVTNEFRNEYDKFCDHARSKYNPILKADYKNFKKYESLKKKFNNKYSTELLEVKKEMDAKLDKAFSDLVNGRATEWLIFDEDSDGKNKKWNEMVELYDKIKEVNRDEAISFVKYVNAYIDIMINAFRGFAMLIRYIRYTLNIEIEDTFKYKIVQKILKDKKGDSGHEEETKEIKLAPFK